MKERTRPYLGSIWDPRRCTEEWLKQAALDIPEYKPVFVKPDFL
jgi:hypothetical protein